MRVAIIGRTEVLYDTALRLHEAGHQIVCILTAKEAPEYTQSAKDFRELADKLKITFAQGPRIIEHKNFLRDANADIAVSMNYVGLVPQSIINLFSLGILNIHGGDLPRYRGNACQAWAILNGEERIGLCIHKMIGDELDSGDIISRDYMSIDHNTSVTKVWHWILRRAPSLVLEALQMLSVNPLYILERQSKDSNLALRCYPRKPEDGRIDWKKQAIDIIRLINASNKPFTGAFCEFEDKKLKIWEAELVKDKDIFCAVPGQVTKIEDDFIEVACGGGKLRIRLSEYDGKVNSPSVWVKSTRKRLM